MRCDPQLCSYSCVSVCVTQLAWYDDEKRFAVGFSDGLIYLATRDEFQQPTRLEAHQVNPSLSASAAAAAGVRLAPPRSDVATH